MELAKDVEAQNGQLVDTGGHVLETASSDTKLLNDPDLNVTALISKATGELVTVKAENDDMDVQLGYNITIANLRSMDTLYFGGGDYGTDTGTIDIQSRVTGWYRNATYLTIKTMDGIVYFPFDEETNDVIMTGELGELIGGDLVDGSADSRRLAFGRSFKKIGSFFSKVKRDINKAVQYMNELKAPKWYITEEHHNHSPLAHNIGVCNAYCMLNGKEASARSEGACDPSIPKSS